jgi:hypothetical protein
MDKADWRVADELVSVTAGNNSYIGKFTNNWYGGVIIIRDAVAYGIRQVMVDVPDPMNIGHSKPTPVQIPAFGLPPWIVSEPLPRLEIVPTHLYRFRDMGEATREAVGSMYLNFLAHLEQARQEDGGLVQQATADVISKLQAAEKDPNSLLSKFGPTRRQ